jgi:integrase
MNDIQSTDDRELRIREIINFLNSNPDEKEIQVALTSLRREKVKEATGATLRAAQFDCEQVAAEFISERQNQKTRETYYRELRRLFAWLDLECVHTLQVRRSDMIRYREALKGRYSANTARLALSVAAVFFAYLEAERYIDHNPAAAIAYPRREYKKAVRPEAGAPLPVMSESEYTRIVSALEERRKAPGGHIGAVRRREAAGRLLPAVRFMGLYGLRVGDLPAVRVHQDGFSTVTKGGRRIRRGAGESWDREAAEALLERLPAAPFRALKVNTIGRRLRELTGELAVAGQLRIAYSPHDLRHLFARMVYAESGDVYQVSRWLSHASLATTQTYLQQLGVLE